MCVLIVSAIVKRLVLPPCAIDWRSRKPLLLFCGLHLDCGEEGGTMLCCVYSLLCVKVLRAGIAQWVECPNEKPGAVLTRVQELPKL